MDSKFDMLITQREREREREREAQTHTHWEQKLLPL